MRLIARVLGEIQLVADGSSVDVGGPQQRRLLAALLARHGSTVSTDQLIEVVFDGDPSDAALRTFRTYVSRLRRALDAQGVDRESVVVTLPSGYAAPVGLEVDAANFESLLRTAREHLDDGEPDAALTAVDEALSWWSGAAYAEFAHEDWARAEAMRLNELHVAAREVRVAAMVESGRHVEAIAELGSLVTEEPLREEPRRLRMLALYRSGRHAEALRAGREFRTLLAEDTGLDWSRSMADLEQRIIECDPTLDAPPRGRRLRGYVLGDKLADHPEGATYRASQPSVGRDVAITVIDARVADDPEFVRRFETRARLVGSLDHPAVATLTDYWREPGAAYLVTPYPKGGTLAGRLERSRPLDSAAAIRLVQQVGVALRAASERGVHHGGLSPDWVWLDTDGGAHIAGFALRDEDRAAANDIATYAALVDRVWQHVTGEAPGRPHDRLAAVRAVAAAASASPESTTLGRLIADLRAAAEEPPSKPGDDSDGSDLSVRRRRVYRGLRPFDEPDADVFFGRRELIDDLTADLCGHPFLALVGPSGSGKSSVVRAGLLPRLRTSGAFIATMLPGRHPIAQLEVALSRVSTTRVPDLRPHLASPEGLVGVVREILPGRGPQLVVLIDQLEEAMTMSDPDQRDLLFDGLARTLDHAAGAVRVVATVRADFLGRLLEHPTLGALVQDHVRLITPLGPEELHQAIVEPAELVGVTVEPELATSLVADSIDAAGSLPLLQFALTELYEHRVDDTMTIDSYHQLGGLGTMVARRAEQTFLALADDDRTAARRLFSRLITPGEGSEDTRRRVPESEIEAVPRSVIEAFATARLLTFDRDPHTREPTVEIAHEALISQWPRLRSWIDEDRAGMLLLRHLTESAGTWADSGRDPAELYRGSRLATAEEWAVEHDDDLTALERDYLDESGRARDREAEDDRRRTQRLRHLTVGLAAVAIVAVVAGVTAVGQRNRAEEQRASAEAQSILAEDQRAAAEASGREVERQAAEADVGRLTAQAVAALEVDSDLAMLLALRAFETSLQLDDEPPGPVISALQQATQSSRVVERFDDAFAPAISPDGRRAVFAVEERRRGLVAVDLDSGQEITRFGRLGWPRVVTFDPAGDRIAVIRDGNGAQQSGAVFDARTFDEIGQFVATACCVGSLRFSPAGALLAGGERVDGSSPDRSVTVWDLGDSDSRTVGEYQRAQLVGWMPDGSTIVLFDGRAVQFVDAATGTERLPEIEVGAVRAIDIDVAGERLLVVREAVAEIWPVGGIGPSDSFGLNTSRGQLQGHFSADGEHVMFFGGDEQIDVVSIESGERTVLRNGPGSVLRISESADGTRLLTESNDAVQLWDRSRAGPAELGNLPTDGAIESLRIARDGTRVIVVEAGVDENDVGRRVREFDLGQRDVASSTARHDSSVVASDDMLVAIGPASTSPGRIEPSDPAAPIVELDRCDVPVAIDDAGRWVLVSSQWVDACGRAGSRIVEPATGDVLADLPDRRFVSAAVGPSGTIADGLAVAVVVIARDQPRSLETFEGVAWAIEVRRLPSGELIDAWFDDGEGFLDPGFSADGRHITIGSATTDGYAIDVERLLDGTSIRDAVVFAGPALGRSTTTTDAGGGWFVAGTSGSELRIYDLTTGDEMMTLPLEDGGPFEITADGRALYYTDGGIVRRFPLDPDELAALARSRVQRDFTVAECERYSIADDCTTYDDPRDG